MVKGYVYILCNRKNGTLYVGVTKDIFARLSEHKAQADPDSFTAKYGVTRLVHLETYDFVSEAIAREKQIKNWKRQWKIALIEEGNPDWEEIRLDWRDVR
ncbi:GIY-YIG nuclease family protein [uncultured Algimonas sp.]|uniref:GIY-YIG nuclease family protein n=1 Tax=uncultured Algimonas sp. TaxID=1547920 RepID=UPI00260C0C1E|nr:GIY-YIG nuclease family protein [uncultured Algimonas sp.]